MLVKQEFAAPAEEPEEAGAPCESRRMSSERPLVKGMSGLLERMKQQELTRDLCFRHIVTLRPGALVGEIALLDGGSSNATIRASAQSEVCHTPSQSTS